MEKFCAVRMPETVETESIPPRSVCPAACSRAAAREARLSAIRLLAEASWLSVRFICRSWFTTVSSVWPSASPCPVT